MVAINLSNYILTETTTRTASISSTPQGFSFFDMYTWWFSINSMWDCVSQWVCKNLNDIDVLKMYLNNNKNEK